MGLWGVAEDHFKNHMKPTPHEQSLEKQRILNELTLRSRVLGALLHAKCTALSAAFAKLEAASKNLETVTADVFRPCPFLAVPAPPPSLQRVYEQRARMDNAVDRLKQITAVEKTVKRFTERAHPGASRRVAHALKTLRAFLRDANTADF